MSNKFKVAQSKTGFGLFATNSYKPNEQILKIEGNIVSWKTLLTLGGVIQANSFRYSPDYYLSPSGVGNYINHSCNPNSGVFKVKKDLMLKAIKPIRPGTQITFDYSTGIADDDSWVMKCHCGAVNCRGRIKNFGSLPAALRQRYIAWGVVPEYVQNA